MGGERGQLWWRMLSHLCCVFCIYMWMCITLWTCCAINPVSFWKIENYQLYGSKAHRKNLSYSKLHTNHVNKKFHLIFFTDFWGAAGLEEVEQGVLLCVIVVLGKYFRFFSWDISPWNLRTVVYTNELWRNIIVSWTT